MAQEAIVAKKALTARKIQEWRERRIWKIKAYSNVSMVAEAIEALLDEEMTNGRIPIVLNQNEIEGYLQKQILRNWRVSFWKQLFSSKTKKQIALETAAEIFWGVIRYHGRHLEQVLRGKYLPLGWQSLRVYRRAFMGYGIIRLGLD